MESQYKHLYNYYKENGELLNLFPELKHRDREAPNLWEQDKKKFIELQEEFENILGKEVDIEDEYTD